MTADVTREPTGGQELREVAEPTRAALTARIAQWLCDLHLGDGAWEDWVLEKDIEHFMAKADELLAGPLAALIADAERVRRVRELADELPVNFWAAVVTGPVESAYRDGFDAGLRSATADIRRALDGEPQP